MSASVTGQSLESLGAEIEPPNHHQIPRVYSITDKDRPADQRQLGEIPASSLDEDPLGEFNRVQYMRMPLDRLDFENDSELRHSNIALRHSRRMMGWLSNEETNTLGRSTYDLFNQSLTLGHQLHLYGRFKDDPSTDLKIGPLYLDFLWSEVHWSHAESWTSGGGHQSDDALMFSLSSLAHLRLLDNWFLTIYSVLTYDVINNRLSYHGTGDNPFLGTFMRYSTELGRWDFSIYHQFRGVQTMALRHTEMYDGDSEDSTSIYVDNEDAFDDLYNKESVSYVSTLDAELSRPVLDEQWQLSFFASHMDIWRNFSFDQHSRRDQLGTRLVYRGNVLPLSPSLQYRANSHNGGPWTHRADLNVRGRVSKNLEIRGLIGAAIRESHSSATYLWSLGAYHRYSSTGMQSLSIGQDAFESEYLPITTYQSFLRYNITQQLSDYHTLEAYYQWTNKSEDWSGSMDHYFEDGGVTHVLGTRFIWRLAPNFNVRQSLQWFHRDSFNRIAYTIDAHYHINQRYSMHSYYQTASQQGHVDRSVHQVGMSMRRAF